MSLYRFSLLLVGLTFVLLLMGGLVHNTNSSLACPDWPLCFGSAFPKMEGGVLVEHSHRLVASAVGLLTTVLMVLLLRRRRRPQEPSWGWLGVGALACVAFQGLLGGITVIYRLPTLISTAHLATSMFFFCLLIYIAFSLRPTPAPALPGKVQRMALSAAALVYVQMVLGALVRHLGAGLACTDLPLCHGQLWPSGVHPNVLLHVTHRLLALLVLGHVTGTAIATCKAAKGRKSIQAMAVAAPALVLVQITLGVLSITSFLSVVPVTAHLAVAALLLADLFSLYLVTRSRVAAQSELADEAPVAARAVA